MPCRSNASHSWVTAQTQLVHACVMVIFPDKVMPPACSLVLVWGGSGRFPLKGGVHHPKAEAWQTSRCWGSEVTNQILLEPQGSSFWKKNSEQWDLNHKRTAIPSGFKPKKMFTPALPHKARFLVLFYCQCMWLPGWKRRWGRSSASLFSHASFVSRTAVVTGTS